MEDIRMESALESKELSSGFWLPVYLVTGFWPMVLGIIWLFAGWSVIVTIVTTILCVLIIIAAVIFCLILLITTPKDFDAARWIFH